REVANPGSRVAVNITGVDKDDLKRGDVLAGPDVVRSTILIDTAYRHLPDADAPLKHNMEVKLFIGAAEVLARTRILGSKEILPGERGWVQLALREPVAVLRGDHFIIRRPSPAATVGGGQILDPHPGRQHRRFRPEVIERLKTLEQGTPGDLLLQKLLRAEPANIRKFQRQTGLDDKQFEKALQELLDDQRVIQLEQQLISRASYQHHIGEMNSMVRRYHQQHPLRLGMPREELRSRLKLPAALFTPLVAKTDLVEDGALVRTAEHEVKFSPTQQKQIDQLLAQFSREGINSPSVKDAKAAVGDDVYFALVDLGQLVPLNEAVVYAAAEYQEITQKIIDFLQQNGQITAAEVRDLLDTSRKYIIAILEHLDQQKITRRTGDVRELIR
ncbi:MAG: SelB C-terminal domain-containing protein, partial [Anaerolineales bacterium]|nr:SelB C-terminal domain-containing protein [Anaerolineales bacterium]